MSTDRVSINKKNYGLGVFNAEVWVGQIVEDIRRPPEGSIVDIDLSENSITDEALDLLVDSLSVLARNLKVKFSLNLRSNSLTVDCVKSLVRGEWFLASVKIPYNYFFPREIYFAMSMLGVKDTNYVEFS